MSARRARRSSPLHQAISLLSRASPCIGVIVAVFCAATLFGFVFPSLFEGIVIELLRMIVSEIGEKSGVALIMHIFFNNLFASFFAMTIGVALGIFPLFSALMNGYVLGYVAHIVVLDEGLFVLWKLFPHGIFELPAVLVSMGVGLFLGSRFLEVVMHVRSLMVRVLVMLLLSLLVVPLAVWYFSASASFVGNEAVIFDALTSSEQLIVLTIALVNIIMVGILFTTIVFFLRSKELRRDLVAALWLFVLFVIPLLVIAGIIEGTLITLFSP